MGVFGPLNPSGHLRNDVEQAAHLVRNHSLTGGQLSVAAVVPLEVIHYCLLELFVFSWWVFRLVVLGHAVCSASRFPQAQVLALPAEDAFVIDGR